MSVLKIFLGVIFFVLSSLYFYYFFKRLLNTFNVFLSLRIKVICLLCALIIGTGCLNYLSFSSMFVYHFIIFSALQDFVFLIAKKILHKKNIILIIKKIICVGIIPLIVTFCVLIYGYNNINNVTQTTYTISSNKITQNYKFLLLSDLHYGDAQKTSVLKDKIEEFNKLDLDFVVLDGDIIDEYSSKQNLIEIFESLGKIQTKYGIYYVYGNHDRQNKTNNKSFSESDIVNELNKNNIKVLSETREIINNEIVLVGREDAQYNSENRRLITELLNGVNKNNFIIVADHQPINIQENVDNNVDLQISGHTHAFQVWPAEFFMNLLGFYSYGDYKIDNMNLIISSGFAGWGFPLRTARKCEYVVVNLTKNQ